ncbi:MAG: hypothetical protein A4S14_03035 [Proteobacteria bacterium SG_bin9]|nr:MAG: hypothetical protein A4S14_03035 [Proteobacteria bacterium SG_bin9]
MFFLLRMTFWIGLVLVLLPTGKPSDSEKLPQLGATEAVTAATAAVSDMSQFCARQPAACEIGGQAATVIGHRAQAGARKVYEFITEKTEKSEQPEKAAGTDKPETAAKPEKVEKPEKTVKPEKPQKAGKKNPDHTGSIGPAVASPDTHGLPAPDNTLTADDLATDWHISGVETVPADH